MKYKVFFLAFLLLFSAFLPLELEALSDGQGNKVSKYFDKDGNKWFKYWVSWGDGGNGTLPLLRKEENLFGLIVINPTRYADGGSYGDLGHSATRFEDLAYQPDLQILKLASGWLHPISTKQLETIALNSRFSTLSIKMHIKGIRFDVLKENSELKKLTIGFASYGGNRNKVENKQLNAINNLDSLETFEFHKLYPGAFEDNSLISLNLLERLKNINIVDSKFPENYIDEFSNIYLPDLEKLTIIDTDSAGIRVDLFAPNLRQLFFEGNEVTEVTVANLQHIPSLETISLRSTEIIPSAVIELENISSLKKIDLSYSSVHGTDFSLFKNLHQLESLNLSGTDITGSDFALLAKLKQLKVLYVKDLTDPAITAVHIKILKMALPNCNIISSES